jgi:hypothetical protein
VYGRAVQYLAISMLSAEMIIETLGLAPLPIEGGFFKETYRSDRSTAIYYLLTPSTCSLLHRLTGDEVYHFYLGDPVEMLELFDGGRSARTVLGSSLEAGEAVQHVVRAGAWQGSRLVEGGRFALMGTTMAPPFDPKMFELGNRRELIARYAERQKMIEELTLPA